MTQHDQNLSNQQGGAFRTDLNNALAAVFGNSSGTAQPTVRVAGQFWFDTSSTTVWTLWLRNAGNSAWIKLFEIDASTVIGMGLQAISGIKRINGGPMQGLRNAIINGDFNIAQRSTTQTISGYGSVDRWYNSHVGSTKTVLRVAHGLGQTAVPGNPKYYLRTTVVSVAGAGNYVIQSQRIESVGTFGGQTVTVTLYAKADAAKNIAVELNQNFGSGGSPSPSVFNIGTTTLALTTAYKKFSFTVDIPTITGKTLGTGNNDCLLLNIWFEGGANWDSRNNALGQQSGVFEISHVSIVEGDATLENDPFSPIPLEREIALCQRTYETSYNLSTVPGTVTTVGMVAQRVATLASATTHTVKMPIPFRTRKRAVPSMVFYSPGLGTSGMATSYPTAAIDVVATSNGTGESASAVILADTRAATEVFYGIHWSATSEL